MPQVALREAVVDDLPDLLRLWRQLESDQGRFRVMPPAPDAERRIEGYLSDAIARADASVVVAEAGGRPVGMALVAMDRPSRMSDERAADIGRLVVEPEWRGLGIGGMLVAKAEELAARWGAAWLTAKIFSENRDAVAFWGRAGFEPHYEQRVRRIRDR